MKYAFKVFYLGINYLGFQRQPNGQTIENFLELAFIKAGLIDSFDSNEYKGSSRTDQGVHALGNVFVLNLFKPPNLFLLNNFLPQDIIVWSYSQVFDDFNPRKKVSKTYKYIIDLQNNFNTDRLKYLDQYQGHHDFTPLLKKHGAGMEYPFTNIEYIGYSQNDSTIIITIVGDRFGREQIRKMIGLLIYPNYEKITPVMILQGNIELSVRSASANGLYLHSVDFHNSLKWHYNSKINYRFSRLMEFLKQRNFLELVFNYMVGEISLFQRA